MSLLPDPIRNNTAFLTLDTEVEHLAQAKSARHRGDLIGAAAQGRLIEVDITRGLDRVVHVQGTVRLVTVEHPVTKRENTVTGVGLIWVEAVFQRRQRHHGLEGRAGRIGARQRLVEQRLALIF